MQSIERPPRIVRWTLRLEQAKALDGTVHAVEPWIRVWFGTGPWGSVLRGKWLGHAVHPTLTDVAIGAWVSGNLLDFLGGPDASASAQQLIGAGVVAAAPTAWTGWAEWSALTPSDKRVGLVHALSNGVAIGLYAASWLARKRGRHLTGIRLALGGAAVAGFGGYLGGHLTEGRRVASHHPAYDEPAVTPARRAGDLWSPARSARRRR